jgi:hypothetical protein
LFILLSSKPQHSPEGEKYPDVKKTIVKETVQENYEKERLFR